MNYRREICVIGYGGLFPRVCLVFAAVCLFGVYGTATEIGVAQCDITPDVETYRVPIAGYGARFGRPAEGVHDQLHAKVLYFRDGDRRMALITTDLRSCTPEFKTQIVSKTPDAFTHDNVFVCASHTHSGPSMYPEKFWQLQFGKYDPAVVLNMSDAVARAVRDAVESAQPARIGFGTARAPGFTRNRRWGYHTEAREAAGEKPSTNPVLWVMRVDSMDGDCRALVVNFATHPTILGADNMELSAEWPGVLQRELEDRFPGATALFFNGALGDQSPAGAEGKNDFEKIRDFGRVWPT